MGIQDLSRNFQLFIKILTALDSLDSETVLFYENSEEEVEKDSDSQGG